MERLSLPLYRMWCQSHSGIKRNHIKGLFSGAGPVFRQGRYLMVLMMTGLVVGCSQQAVYENYQSYKRNECYRLPPSQQEECLERANQSFEEYERARKGD